MIDSVTIQLPFSSSWVSSSASKFELNTPDPFSRDVVATIDPRYLPNIVGAKEVFYTKNGLEISDVYCPWESIKSSHSGMALKVFYSGNGLCKWPYVEIKCSPAKLVQGHNVYGFDDLVFSVSNMLALLNKAYPEFFAGYEVLEDRGPMLDTENARLSAIDITYSINVPDDKKRFAFIDFIRTLSKGHTKNNSNSYESTVYFGSKNSRLKKLKIYLKGIELENDIKDRKRKGLSIPSEAVIKQATDLVRIEATLKKDWLERRGYDTNLKAFLKLTKRDTTLISKLFAIATTDFFEALQGQEVTIMNDDKVYSAIDAVHCETRGKTARLFGFYQGLKTVGYERYKKQFPKQTFYRNLKEIEMCGFSRATLCNLHLQDSVVVKLPTIINLESCHEPAPENYNYKLYAVA